MSKKNDCIKRNYDLKKKILNSSIHKDRIEILQKFIRKFKKVVDIGCGGFMPILLNINQACDIDFLAEKLLKKDGWKGKFKKASVTKLPYKNKEFDVAICSEVIEHLLTKKAVLKAFAEIERVSKHWIVTTPAAYDKDTDHKFHFGYNEDNIFDVIPKELKFKVVWKGYYYYISNDGKILCDITGAKDG